MSAQVSSEFAGLYRTITGSALEQLRSNPELMQIPEFREKMTFCAHGNREMIPTMMHYSGVVLYTANIDNLFYLVKQHRNPWEITMSLLALAGWPYEGLLQRSYIDTCEKLGAMWELLLELHSKQQVPQACWNWLKLKVSKSSGVFPQDMEAKVKELGQ